MIKGGRGWRIWRMENGLERDNGRQQKGDKK